VDDQYCPSCRTSHPGASDEQICYSRCGIRFQRVSNPDEGGNREGKHSGSDSLSLINDSVGNFARVGQMEPPKFGLASEIWTCCSLRPQASVLFADILHIASARPTRALC
jgi:hypothetical protein